MQILYEDNHIIIVNKPPCAIVQGDITGDKTLIDEVKDYLKVKYNKQGNVYVGLPHRLDRPTSGLVIFSKTSKSLSRFCEMFANSSIEKTYIAITSELLEKDSGELVNYILRNQQQNKSYVVQKDIKGAKYARLRYKLACKTDNYFVYIINLYTGRHHQIRCQLAAKGVHIKGDLKYGASRSNKDGSICLHSWRVRFKHPVSGKNIELYAPFPPTEPWNSINAEELKFLCNA